jgi:DNA helicase-2/ATP-dependent DNA helicase PcrA
MMTIHSAKGLEFPVVFLPGMEDGIFPGMQNITSMNPDDLEEERRLAYVAITRAKSEVYITHTKVRTLYNKTTYNPLSRFVEEIPKELIIEDKPKYQMPISGVKSYFSPRNVETVGTVSKKPSGNLMLNEGDRVHHGTFGDGEILSVTKMGSDVLYEVIFDNAGTKKLMGSFARLKKI